MNYLLLCVTVGLVWFLTVNLAVSFAVAAASRRTMSSLISVRPSLRANWLLVLRLLPSAASVVFVCGVFLPSFVRLEPRGDFDEPLGPTIVMAAGLAAGVCLVGVGRGALAWRRARTRARTWIGRATRVALADSLPAFRIESSRAALMLAGLFKPQLLVTSALVDALSEEELAASVAHEQHHGRSRDNLKRLAMRSAPDVLSWMPAAARLEHEWALAAEYAADEQATAGNQHVAIALASALVKIARLNPMRPARLEPISTLTADEGLLAARVRRLVEPGPAPQPPPPRSARWLALAIATAIGLVLVYAPLLTSVHAATELLVRHLP